MKSQFLFRNDISLSQLSTFQIGGLAKEYIKVKSPEELVEVVRWAREHGKKFKVFAGGSNVVFPDEGLKCLVIQVVGGKCAVNMREIMVDSGVYLKDLINQAIGNGLSGLESLSGIPGTIGGAVVGNAGAYGHSISEVVEKVEIYDTYSLLGSFQAGSAANGDFAEVAQKFFPFQRDPETSGTQKFSCSPQNLSTSLAPPTSIYARKSSFPTNSKSSFVRKWLSKKECDFAYRESIFKKRDYLILRVLLRLGKGDREELNKISKDIIKRREEKYHPGLKCPGSFFKNVLVKDIDNNSLEKIENEVIIDGKIPAGYLLSRVGARGMKVGGIEIANFHGNLFINNGKGTENDVRRLAAILKEKVRERFGIQLEEEIRYF